MNAHCVTTPRFALAVPGVFLLGSLLACAGCTQIAPESLKSETASPKRSASTAQKPSQKSEGGGFFARIFRREPVEKPDTATRIAAKRDAQRKAAESRAVLAEDRKAPHRDGRARGDRQLATRTPGKSRAAPGASPAKESEIALVEARDRNDRQAGEPASRTARRGTGAQVKPAARPDDRQPASESNKLASSVSALLKRRSEAAEDPFLEQTAAAARSSSQRGEAGRRETRETAEKRAGAPAASRDAMDPLADPALDFARADASRARRASSAAINDQLDHALPAATGTARPTQRMTADEFLKLTGGGSARPLPRPAASARSTVSANTASKPPVVAAAPASRPSDTEDEARGASAAPQAQYELERARRLLERAREMAAGGFPEEALRLAGIAQLLEHSHPELFEAGEPRPSEFIAAINESSAAQSTAQTAKVTRDEPEEPADVAASPREPIVSRRGTAAVPRETADSSSLEVRPGEAKYYELPEPDSAQVGRYSRTPRESILEYHSRRIARQREAQDPASRQGAILASGSDAPENRFGASRKDRNLLVALAEAVDGSDDEGSDGEVTTAEAHSSPVIRTSRNHQPAPGPDRAQDLFDESWQGEPAAAPPVPPAGNKPSINLAATAGLVVGLLGMAGLALWQRAERRHCKAGLNRRAASAAAPTSAG